MYLLSIENVIVGPIFADAETFMKATVFIRLCKQPGCIHEVLACDCIIPSMNILQSRKLLTLKILCNLLIPESHISLVVVNDGSQLGVSAEVNHEIIHALNALNEVNDFVL